MLGFRKASCTVLNALHRFDAWSLIGTFGAFGSGRGHISAVEMAAMPVYLGVYKHCPAEWAFDDTNERRKQVGS